MKLFNTNTSSQVEPEAIRCNLCGRYVEKNQIGYFEDHISVTKMWGYHSPYDGEAHAIDLCVDCYENWTRKFQIPPKVDASGVGVWE